MSPDALLDELARCYAAAVVRRLLEDAREHLHCAPSVTPDNPELSVTPDEFDEAEQF